MNAIVLRMSCAGCEHGGQAEAPLEPDGEIERVTMNEKKIARNALLELAPHLRADRLGAETL